MREPADGEDEANHRQENGQQVERHHCPSGKKVEGASLDDVIQFVSTQVG